MLFITQGHSVSFLGVCAREEKSERQRRSKLVSSSPSFLNFQRAFSVNKYERECSFSFFFYSISGVRSARYNLYEKKGKTVTPSRKLRAKGDTSSLQTGKQLYQYPCACACAELQESSISRPFVTPLYNVSCSILWDICILFPSFCIISFLVFALSQPIRFVYIIRK